MKIKNVLSVIMIAAAAFVAQPAIFAGEMPQLMGHKAFVQDMSVMQSAKADINDAVDSLFAEDKSQRFDELTAELIIKQIAILVPAEQRFKKMNNAFRLEKMEQSAEETYSTKFVNAIKKLGAALVAPFRGYTQEEKDIARDIITKLVEQQEKITAKYDAFAADKKAQLKNRYEAVMAQMNNAIYEQQVITGDATSTQKKLLAGAAVAAGTAAGLTLAKLYFDGATSDATELPEEVLITEEPVITEQPTQVIEPVMVTPTVIESPIVEIPVIKSESIIMPEEIITTQLPEQQVQLSDLENVVAIDPVVESTQEEIQEPMVTESMQDLQDPVVIAPMEEVVDEQETASNLEDMAAKLAEVQNVELEENSLADQAVREQLKAEQLAAQATILEEEERMLEQAKLEKLEEVRLAKLEEERLEQEILAEQERLEQARRVAEQARMAEEARIAEQARLAEELRVAEQVRLEQERLAKLEEERLAEEAKVAEQARIAEAVELEQERLAQEQADTLEAAQIVEPTVETVESDIVEQEQPEVMEQELLTTEQPTTETVMPEVETIETELQEPAVVELEESEVQPQELVEEEPSEFKINEDQML